MPQHFIFKGFSTPILWYLETEANWTFVFLPKHTNLEHWNLSSSSMHPLIWSITFLLLNKAVKSKKYIKIGRIKRRNHNGTNCSIGKKFEVFEYTIISRRHEKNKDIIHSVWLKLSGQKLVENFSLSSNF